MGVSIEDRILDFVYIQLHPFTVDDILQDLGMSFDKDLVQKIITFLKSRSIAFTRAKKPKSTDFWLSRTGLFSARSLIIEPTPEEITQGILIVGSRCMPFYNSALLPHELSFYFDDEILDNKIISISKARAYKYYELFGDEYIFQYLVSDNDLNADFYKTTDFEDPESFDISVVDMSSFYWKSGFRPGDRLFATLVDWHTGVFFLDIVPAASIPKLKEKEWEDALKQGFKESFKRIGAGDSIEDQMACAYFFGPKRIFSKYGYEVARFIKQDSFLSFVDYGVETRLWGKDSEVDLPKEWPLSDSYLLMSPLELLLSEIDVYISRFIIVSYILDALYKKKEECSSVVDLLLSSASSNKNAQIIKEHISVLFNKHKDDYNIFKDTEKGLIRSKLVELHYNIRLYILRLKEEKIMPCDIPLQGGVVLFQLFSSTELALENLDFPIYFEQFNLNSFLRSVENMEESFFEVKTLIAEISPDLFKRRFTLLGED